ncbi:hypothetical protein [Pseudomonas sp. 460]|uniref:hypothetical protein n=1 Tax=Pseudomonas sp. 460 TaxID=2485142 RepID=UPI001404900E|nr:hypothetical protein [Pseudomonas sp. 460]
MNAVTHLSIRVAMSDLEVVSAQQAQDLHDNFLDIRKPRTNHAHGGFIQLMQLGTCRFAHWQSFRLGQIGQATQTVDLSMNIPTPNIFLTGTFRLDEPFELGEFSLNNSD